MNLRASCFSRSLKNQINKAVFRTWEKLYTSIWGVQDFFRSPLGMYEPEKFKIFEESVNKIIETFKNYKLGLVIDPRPMIFR